MNLTNSDAAFIGREKVGVPSLVPLADFVFSARLGFSLGRGRDVIPCGFFSSPCSFH